MDKKDLAIAVLGGLFGVAVVMLFSLVIAEKLGPWSPLKPELVVAEAEGSGSAGLISIGDGAANTWPLGPADLQGLDIAGLSGQAAVPQGLAVTLRIQESDLVNRIVDGLDYATNGISGQLLSTSEQVLESSVAESLPTRIDVSLEDLTAGATLDVKPIPEAVHQETGGLLQSFLD